MKRDFLTYLRPPSLLETLGGTDQVACDNMYDNRGTHSKRHRNAAGMDSIAIGSPPAHVICTPIQNKTTPRHVYHPLRSVLLSHAYMLPRGGSRGGGGGGGS